MDGQEGVVVVDVSSAILRFSDNHLDDTFKQERTETDAGCRLLAACCSLVSLRCGRQVVMRFVPAVLGEQIVTLLPAELAHYCRDTGLCI